MRDPMQGYDAWKTREPDLPDPPENDEANIEALCQAKYDKMSPEPYPFLNTGRF